MIIIILKRQFDNIFRRLRFFLIFTAFVPVPYFSQQTGIYALKRFKNGQTQG
jgi:hypothetical protein